VIPELLLQKATEKGGDDKYQAYIRGFPSCLTNDFKEFPNGEGRSVFAHIRKNAGTGYKPPYSGVPLTQVQHANQHQHGYEYYNPMSWWENKRDEYLAKWVNNVKPPVLPVVRSQETYILESANHINAIKEMLGEYFKNPTAKPIEITVKTDNRKRSNVQNASQWGVVYNNIAEFYQDNQVALGSDMIRSIQDYKLDKDSLHAMLKRLHNQNQSTARLTISQHSNYFEDIANFYLINYEYEVQMPINTQGDNQWINS